MMRLFLMAGGIIGSFSIPDTHFYSRHIMLLICRYVGLNGIHTLFIKFSPQVIRPFFLLGLACFAAAFFSFFPYFNMTSSASVTRLPP